MGWWKTGFLVGGNKGVHRHRPGWQPNATPSGWRLKHNDPPLTGPSTDNGKVTRAGFQKLLLLRVECLRGADRALLRGGNQMGRWPAAPEAAINCSFPAIKPVSHLLVPFTRRPHKRQPLACLQKKALVGTASTGAYHKTTQAGLDCLAHGQ